MADYVVLYYDRTFKTIPAKSLDQLAEEIIKIRKKSGILMVFSPSEEVSAVCRTSTLNLLVRKLKDH